MIILRQKEFGVISRIAEYEMKRARKGVAKAGLSAWRNNPNIETRNKIKELVSDANTALKPKKVMDLGTSSYYSGRGSRNIIKLERLDPTKTRSRLS